MRLKPTKQEQALMLEASLLRTDLQLARERIATLESHVETLTKALEAALEGLQGVIDYGEIPHDDVSVDGGSEDVIDCPRDDTCPCPIPAKINEAFRFGTPALAAVREPAKGTK